MTPSSRSAIAVLGLGAMGLPMAQRLAETFPVRGFDPEPTRRELASEQGLETTDSAETAVSGCGIVLIAVRDSAQLHDVLFGDQGIADSLTPGAAVILTSTIGVDGIAESAEALGSRGLHLVDAPLSGGPARAAQGDLLIVVGATPAGYEIARDALHQLGSTVKVVGDRPGSGQAIKTVNQLLCGVHIAAAAEALSLARRMGLDTAEVLETLQLGAAESFMLGNRGPRMLESYSKKAEVLSRLDIFTKDMGIVTSSAKKLGLATPVAAAAEQLFVIGAQLGLADSDDSSVITVIDGGSGKN